MRGIPANAGGQSDGSPSEDALGAVGREGTGTLRVRRLVASQCCRRGYLSSGRFRSNGYIRTGEERLGRVVQHNVLGRRR